jgi:C-terminal processing protease CtpA/Prc
MKLKVFVGLWLVSFSPLVGWAGEAVTNDAPDFKEVYELLRGNLKDASEAELNRAAVQGLLSQLKSRAALTGESKEGRPGGGSDSSFRTAVFDESYAYLRIGQIGAGVDQQVLTAYQQLASSNRIKGVVFDLRFADGQDYAAATALADLFFSTEKPLLDYGDGLKKSTAKTNAFSLPLAVLVNRQTTGAAEAFAGVLRQASIGLLIGTNTAGKATMGKEFALKNGQRLRIATSLIKLGNGQTFPAVGLQPDIHVEVNPEDEQAYFEDAYKILQKGARVSNSATNQANLSVTNRLPHHRTTEAELVRMHRDGELPDADAPAARSRENEASLHVIYDPALARAIDLLKGLSVVQQFRSI